MKVKCEEARKKEEGTVLIIPQQRELTYLLPKIETQIERDEVVLVRSRVQKRVLVQRTVVN